MSINQFQSLKGIYWDFETAQPPKSRTQILQFQSLKGIYWDFEAHRRWVGLVSESVSIPQRDLLGFRGDGYYFLNR